MIKLSWFKSKDATNTDILLVILGILISSTVYLYPENFDNWPDTEWKNVKEGGLRSSLVQTRCYHIPYTREQLKEIWINGGSEKKELNRILSKETEDEDLDEIVGPPKIIFDEESARVCLDFKDKLNPEPTHSKARLI